MMSVHHAFARSLAASRRSEGLRQGHHAPGVARQAPSLKTIEVFGCNVPRPPARRRPPVACSEGLEAMRRYWAELAAVSVQCAMLKMVLVGGRGRGGQDEPASPAA